MQLAGDFKLNPAEEVDEDNVAEYRLCYVAVTRAQHELDITNCPALGTVVAGANTQQTV